MEDTNEIASFMATTTSQLAETSRNLSRLEAAVAKMLENAETENVRLKERQYKLSEHQHSMGLILERTVTTMAHVQQQLSRIEQMATSAAEQHERLSEAMAVVRDRQDNGRVTAAGWGAGAGAVIVAVLQALASWLHIGLPQAKQ